jgi:hypothetical protein
MSGRAAAECLNEVTPSYREISEASFICWKQTFSPDIISENLISAIERCDYTVGEYVRSGASRPGALGGLLEVVKRRIFGRIY